MVGFRNMATEMSFPQDKATTIYQDNEASTQIMVNRGSLSKQSRHMERRILAARNKIEDEEVFPNIAGQMRWWQTLARRHFRTGSSST
jgi:hypothetical protein